MSFRDDLNNLDERIGLSQAFKFLFMLAALPFFAIFMASGASPMVAFMGGMSVVVLAGSALITDNDPKRQIRVRRGVMLFGATFLALAVGAQTLAHVRGFSQDGADLLVMQIYGLLMVIVLPVAIIGMLYELIQQLTGRAPVETDNILLMALIAVLYFSPLVWGVNWLLNRLGVPGADTLGGIVFFVGAGIVGWATWRRLSQLAGAQREADGDTPE